MTTLHHPEVQKVILVQYLESTMAVVTTPHDQESFDAAVTALREKIAQADDPAKWDLVDYRSDPLSDVLERCIV